MTGKEICEYCTEHTDISCSECEHADRCKKFKEKLHDAEPHEVYRVINDTQF